MLMREVLKRKTKNTKQIELEEENNIKDRSADKRGMMNVEDQCKDKNNETRQYNQRNMDTEKIR